MACDDMQVVIGLSLANEGLPECLVNPSDCQAVYDHYEKGMLQLIARIRAAGAQPIGEPPCTAVHCGHPPSCPLCSVCAAIRYPRRCPGPYGWLQSLRLAAALPEPVPK
jgi:hypothetical protein